MGHWVQVAVRAVRRGRHWEVNGGVPPGWYPDPGDADYLCWWNGSSWTANTFGPVTNRWVDGPVGGLQRFSGDHPEVTRERYASFEGAARGHWPRTRLDSSPRRWVRVIAVLVPAGMAVAWWRLPREFGEVFPWLLPVSMFLVLVASVRAVLDRVGVSSLVRLGPDVVELSGTISSDERPVESFLCSAKCLWYRASLQVARSERRGRRWRTVLIDVRAVDVVRLSTSVGDFWLDSRVWSPVWSSVAPGVHRSQINWVCEEQLLGAGTAVAMFARVRRSGGRAWLEPAGPSAVVLPNSAHVGDGAGSRDLIASFRQSARELSWACGSLAAVAAVQLTALVRSGDRWSVGSSVTGRSLAVPAALLVVGALGALGAELWRWRVGRRRNG